jgi:TPR repeat protein
MVLWGANTLSNNRLQLNAKEITELYKLAANNDTLAIKKLANHYYFIENNPNKVANLYRHFKDINPKIKLALYHFLSNHHSINREKDEIVNILKELAKNGDIEAINSLVHLYKHGEISAYTGEIFIEQNLTKSKYWGKVAQCIHNQECLKTIEDNNK